MELSTNLPSTEREFSEIDELIHQLEDEVCTLESKLKKAEKNSDKYRAEVVTEQQRSFERISQVRAEKSERFFLLFSLVVKLCESNALSHLEKELIRDFVLEGAEFLVILPLMFPRGSSFGLQIHQPRSLPSSSRILTTNLKLQNLRMRVFSKRSIENLTMSSINCGRAKLSACPININGS